MEEQPRLRIVEVKTVTCKNCGSTNVIGKGSYKGVSRYLCLDCDRKFKGDEAAFHSKVPAEYISSALSGYYSGMSINDIRNHLKQEHGYYPSKSVVWNWIDKYTDIAAQQFKDFKPKVGNRWVADETVLTLDNGHNVWFWDVIDSRTRFLLATRVTFNRTTAHAQRLMEEAKRRAGKSPKYIVTDKQNSYFDGVGAAFGAKAEHVMTSPFGEGKDSTAKIERWHETLKDRTKVMKSFRNMDTLLSFADGYLIYYNYLKPHTALKGKTPAEAAKVDYPLKNWADIIRLPVSKEAESASHKLLILKTPKPTTMLPKGTRARFKESQGRMKQARELPAGEMYVMRGSGGGNILSRRKQKGARVVRRIRRLI